MLTALTSLDCRHNPLRGGWQHLQPLTHLERMYLSSCDIVQLPSVLSTLTALTTLHLFGNPVAGGREHLQSLALVEDDGRAPWI